MAGEADKDGDSSMGPRQPHKLLALNSNASLSSSRQLSVGPQGDSSSSSSSHLPSGDTSNEQQQQSFFGCSKTEEELSCAAVAAAAEADLPGDTAGFAQWLSRLDVLEALRHVLQDGASVCLNSTRKVDAMLILKGLLEAAALLARMSFKCATAAVPPGKKTADSKRPPNTSSAPNTSALLESQILQETEEDGEALGDEALGSADTQQLRSIGSLHAHNRLDLHAASPLLLLLLLLLLLQLLLLLLLLVLALSKEVEPPSPLCQRLASQMAK
ncbi:hypothetical protein Emed_007262 [Eimeria media]